MVYALFRRNNSVYNIWIICRNKSYEENDLENVVSESQGMNFVKTIFEL